MRRKGVLAKECDENQKNRFFKRNVTKETFFSYIFHVVRKR